MWGGQLIWKLLYWGRTRWNFDRTVDGRNPAPVDMVDMALFAGFHTCSGGAGFLPSTVAPMVSLDTWIRTSQNHILSSWGNQFTVSLRLVLKNSRKGFDVTKGESEMIFFQKVHEPSMSQLQTARQRSSEWIFMKFYLPRQGPSLHLSIAWHGSPTILVDVLAYQQYKEPILRFSGLEMLILIMIDNPDRWQDCQPKRGLE